MANDVNRRHLSPAFILGLLIFLAIAVLIIDQMIIVPHQQTKALRDAFNGQIEAAQHWTAAQCGPISTTIQPPWGLDAQPQHVVLGEKVDGATWSSQDHGDYDDIIVTRSDGSHRTVKRYHPNSDVCRSQQ